MAYKKAKLLSKDLREIITTVDMCLHNFKPYNKYMPVKSIVNSLLENKVILTMYLKKYTKIVGNKGLMKNVQKEE
jgi:hypothetical protein